jgi:hypothetical protein
LECVPCRSCRRLRSFDLCFQATLAFNALRNATSNFTMSCGSSRCGTFTSAIFIFLVMVGRGSLAKSCLSLEGLFEK